MPPRPRPRQPPRLNHEVMQNVLHEMLIGTALYGTFIINDMTPDKHFEELPENAACFSKLPW